MSLRNIVILVLAGFVLLCAGLIVDSGFFKTTHLSVSSNTTSADLQARSRGAILLQQTTDAQAPLNSVEPNKPAVEATPQPPAPQAPALAASGFSAEGGAEQKVVIGSTDKATGFKYELELDSRGAAIRTATFSEYDTRTGKTHEPLVFLSPVHLANGREVLSMANRELILTQEKHQLGLDRLSWKSLGVETTADGSQTARFEAVILDSADRPLLKLTKTYAVRRDNYLLDCNLAVENLSQLPEGVRWNLAGPVGVEREDPRSDDRKIVGGFRDARGQILGVRINIASFDAHETFAEKVLGNERQPNQEFLWAAGVNKYFAGVLVPLPQDGKTFCDWITGKRNEAGGRETMLRDKKGLWPGLRRLFTGKPDTEAIEKTGRYGQYHSPDGRAASGDENIGIGLEIDYANLSPAGEPQASRTYSFQLYLGPKDKSLFDKTDLYRRLGFVQTIDFMACCCPVWLVGPLAFAILTLMKWMYFIIPNYGVVIIILVLLMRLVLHPVTRHGQVAMNKMGKLGPRAEEIKKKYGNNKAEMNKKLMELYREQGASPIMGFLPMFLQMPIWIALWSAIYMSIDLRGAAFLPFWITDLSAPDALVSWPPFTIPLLGWTIHSLNLLPILMGVAFYLQQKIMPMQPAAAATNPQMAQQQKIMTIMMPLMFPLMLYNGPAGVNLYIMASTFGGVFEQYVIKKHIREKEEQEAQGLISATSKTGGKVKKKRPKPFYRFR
jgi:YidC/Oxa1 family membrane protein insertase